MKKDKEFILEEFKKHSIIFAETQETGNYKKGNRSSAIVMEIGDLMGVFSIMDSKKGERWRHDVWIY